MSQNYLYFYARVSHHDSAMSGKGMESQMRKCAAWFKYCRETGRFPEHRLGGGGVVFLKSKKQASKTSGILTMEDNNDPFYIDESTSAKKKEFCTRPAGYLLDLRLKKGDVVVFAYLDRAFRSFKDFAVTCQKWIDRGVAVIFLDPQVDMTDIWGRAMAGIFAIFAQLDSDLKSKRNKEIAANPETRQKCEKRGTMKRIKTNNGIVHVPDLYKRWEILELLSGWRKMQKASQTIPGVGAITFRKMEDWIETVRARHENRAPYRFLDGHDPNYPDRKRYWRAASIEKFLNRDQGKVEMMHGIDEACRPAVEAQLQDFRLNALAALGEKLMPPCMLEKLLTTGAPSHAP